MVLIESGEDQWKVAGIHFLNVTDPAGATPSGIATE